MGVLLLGPYNGSQALLFWVYFTRPLFVGNSQVRFRQLQVTVERLFGSGYCTQFLELAQPSSAPTCVAGGAWRIRFGGNVGSASLKKQRLDSAWTAMVYEGYY